MLQPENTRSLENYLQILYLRPKTDGVDVSDAVHTIPRCVYIYFSVQSVT